MNESKQADGREQRGLEIAARSRIEQREGAWFVPAQSKTGNYAVIMGARGARCTCPDYETRMMKCKNTSSPSST